MAFGPADIGAVLQGVGAVGQTMAIIGAAWLAADSLKNWKAQKLSERRMEHSERILVATYKVRRGLSALRNPSIWPNEMASAEEFLKLNGSWPATQSDQYKKLTIQVYHSRLHAQKDSRLQLEECQPLARALFDEDLEQSIIDLNQQFNTVAVHVNLLDRSWERMHEGRTLNINRAIYEGFPEDDESPNKIDQIIAALVKQIEDACVPELRLGRAKRKA